MDIRKLNKQEYFTYVRIPKKGTVKLFLRFLLSEYKIKVLGMAMVALGIVAGILMPEDATASMVASVAGTLLIATKMEVE